jgi:biotin carboxylase
LTPETANDPATLLDRFHKAHMQRSLERAGVPALKTLDASSEEQVAAWLEENDLSASDLVIKPPISAGSEKVLHVSAENWRTALQTVLASASNITGKRNETAVVQERAYGTEFAVGTVSANGKHSLAHLIQYNKKSFNGSETVYDHVEFVPFREDVHGELLAYTNRVLDALGVRWGAAHNEIMLTPRGPRLIESVPRMTGGPVVEFAREATGSSQADKLVEAYADGRITDGDYRVSKAVVPVFLSSPSAGLIGNVEALSEVTALPTYFRKFLWFKNGDRVPRTVDYLTSIGIVALSGDRRAVFEDYERIRAMEARLVVHP